MIGDEVFGVDIEDQDIEKRSPPQRTFQKKQIYFKKRAILHQR